MDTPDQATGARGENVDDGVAAPREPQLTAVGRDAAHVRGAPARQAPGGPDREGRGVQDRDGALVPVGDEDLGCVAAGVDPVSALPRGQEAADPEGCAVDQPDAVAEHVRYEEGPAVGCEADVLRHRAHAWAYAVCGP